MANFWETCRDTVKLCARTIASKPKELLTLKSPQTKQAPLMSDRADMIPMGGSPDSLSVASSTENSPISDIFGHDDFVTVFDAPVIRYEQIMDCYVPNPLEITAKELSNDAELFEQDYGLDETVGRSSGSLEIDLDEDEGEEVIAGNQIFFKADEVRKVGSDDSTRETADDESLAGTGCVNGIEHQVSRIATEWLFIGLVICVMVPIYLVGLSDST